MSRCRVPIENLIDYHSGQTDAPTTDHVRKHLEIGCPRCESESVWIVRTLSALRALQSPPVPETALTAARVLFRERHMQRERPRILARLRFDSRATPTLALARGTHSRTVQTIYEAYEHDFELWQEEQEDGSWYLIGYVLPKHTGGSAESNSVTLLETGSGDLRAFSAPGSTINEFHLDRIVAGVYDIEVHLADADVYLKDVVVGG